MGDKRAELIQTVDPLVGRFLAFGIPRVSGCGESPAVVGCAYWRCLSHASQSSSVGTATVS